MQYSKFGSLDWEVSVIGFGSMRLSLLDDDMANRMCCSPSRGYAMLLIMA